MIDYEKLKLAHELVSKIPFSKITHIYSNEDGSMFTLTSPDLSFRYISNIDELIEKLQELTKPEPKYKVGQRLWYLYNKDTCDFIVDKISHHDEGFVYHTNGWGFLLEHDAFPTRKDLIKSQIKHWQLLLADELRACIHEPDGNMYASHPFMSRCKHCGEFY